MTNNLVLIGFMGTGKTTIARLASRLLGVEPIEVDHMIEQRAGKPIPSIFQEDGESAFRSLETKCLEELQEVRQSVISVGGGAPCQELNVPIIKNLGYIVELTASADAILERIGDPAARPMLAGTGELRERIESLMAEREPHYRIAHNRVSTTLLSSKQSSEQIVEQYRKWLRGQH